MTQLLKILRAQHRDAILTIGFILSLPIQFLVGLQIAKWLT